MFKPIAKPDTADLFREDVDINNSLSRKQELLGGLFSKQTEQGSFEKEGEDGILHFSNKNNRYLHKMLMNEGGIVAFKIAANKRMMLHTATFTDRMFEDHPNSVVIIDNRKDRQVMAVEDNRKVFVNTKAVVNILTATFNNLLAPYRLMMTIDAKFHKNEFWRVVDNYQNGIKSVKFSFPYPNLPVISDLVSETMRRVAVEMNCEPTQLLTAPDGQILNLSRDSDMLIDMIEACAASGKAILLRPVGKRGDVKCNTEQSLVREILDDDVIKGLSERDFFNKSRESTTEFMNSIKLVYD